MDQPAPAIPPYEFLEELGRGTTGIVYRVFDTQLKRVVALKIPLPGSAADMVKRRNHFLQEARFVASRDDPHIPRLHQIGESQGQPYLVREFVVGTSLERLAAIGSLGWREAVGVLAVIAGVVQRVHEKGFVHRNLDPSNVLVAADGAPKLIGFGRFGLLSTSKGATVEADVRALQMMLAWLGSTLGQAPTPRLVALCQPGAVASAAAFVEALGNGP